MQNIFRWCRQLKLEEDIIYSSQYLCVLQNNNNKTI
jgi:hypothetical protein